MPPKNTQRKENEVNSQSSLDKQSQKVRDLFSIPFQLKRIFDQVPILTYAPNELPQQPPKPSRIPNLYVFSTDEDATAGRPSFNPSCLKWQTFLNIAGIDHRLVSSNNHASPTGSLPFLLPVTINSSQDALTPVTTNKFLKYAAENGSQIQTPISLRSEAYQSLLDHRIRNAWLYTLYLEPENFSAVAYKLYVSPTSTNLLVRASTSFTLRAAAEAELLKYTSVIDTDDLYSEADKAFEALATLLGEDSWFFGGAKPSLFDASVFAYTQLILDEGMGWAEKKLSRALRRRENLVRHRDRLLVRYFGGSA